MICKLLLHNRISLTIQIFSRNIASVMECDVVYQHYSFVSPKIRYDESRHAFFGYKQSVSKQGSGKLCR